MLAKGAVKAFLERELDDHSWLKNIDEKKLDDALWKLEPRPKFEDAGFHQKVGILLGIAYPQFYFIYDMGTGKSYLGSRLVQHHYRAQTIDGITFVFAPTDAAADGWSTQLDLWTPGEPYEVLLGSSEKKWRTLSRLKRGIAVVTYVGFAAMVSELRDDPKKKGKRKRFLSINALATLAQRSTATVMDESTYMGHTDSLMYQAVRRVSWNHAVRFALAGRPFGKDATMLWPQCFLVDHGQSLGANVGIFREAFFTKKKKFWGGPHSFDYKLDVKKEPELARALAHRSLRYGADECLDLPDKINTIRRVEFPNDMETYYKQVTEALINAKGDFTEVEHAFIRMRQIASGFIGFKNDETGEKAHVEFKHSPKLEELMLLIDEQPDNTKFLIFHEYTWTGSRICRELTKAKIKHGWLWGGTKDWPTMKARFNEDPEFRGLVINHKKGAFSLDLQASNYTYVFESPVSPIDREQMERRNYRQGQTRTVFLTDLVVKGSIDERILEFHKTGEKLFQSLVVNPKKVLGL